MISKSLTTPFTNTTCDNTKVLYFPSNNTQQECTPFSNILYGKCKSPAWWAKVKPGRRISKWLLPVTNLNSHNNVN